MLKKASAVLALATAFIGVAAIRPLPQFPGQQRWSVTPAYSQSSVPTFTLPTTVPQGTQVRISSSSDRMTAINTTLKRSFENQFAGAQVKVTPAATATAAIQNVRSREADLAAISRPLTTAEQQQGFVAIPVKRVKIAILVATTNPFKGTLSSAQFAQIFRGEITNWSQVGGKAGPMRLMDYPQTSDLRSALAAYPTFGGPPETASQTSTQANQSPPSEPKLTNLASALKADGIGYALVTDIEGQSGLRVLEMYKTLPNDPRYPFSQPFAYVYQGEPTAAVKAFLGYATTAPGQAALNQVSVNLPVAAVANTATAAAGEARTGDAGTGAAGAGDTGTGDAGTGNAGTGTSNGNGNGNEANADRAAGSSVPSGRGSGSATGNTVSEATAGQQAQTQDGVNLEAVTPEAVIESSPVAEMRHLWWLLAIPLVCLGLVLLANRRAKKLPEEIILTEMDPEGPAADHETLSIETAETSLTADLLSEEKAETGAATSNGAKAAVQQLPKIGQGQGSGTTSALGDEIPQTAKGWLYGMAEDSILEGGVPDWGMAYQAVVERGQPSHHPAVDDSDP